ncbi:MAG: PspC domain-containing protein [Bacteroidetes bacterium]|nr:PspC domain-containing protein [Bacteroidota bacterium]
MEKVFQVNLGGVIFFIEESAYHQLRTYINELHAHFAGNTEIVSDIESRMAELFSERLDTSRNTLNTEDVNYVCGIMGDIGQMSAEEESKAIHGAPVSDKFRVRRLRRNPFDSKLGGVASGFASFFQIDPVIVRLLFVVSVIVYGSGILFYLVLWVVLPEARGEESEAMRLQKLHRTRRLFRDPDNRVLSGVSSGLAAYFGLDVVWIRLAFVVALFAFGSGFWLYIILWAITPKAQTAADKLMMRGEPVDIKSIEKEVMSGAGGPGRIGQFTERGGDVLGTLLRGFVKLVLGFIAFLVFIMIVAISVGVISTFMNIGNTAWLNEMIDFAIKDQSLIWAGKLGLFLVLVAPALGLLLLLIRLIFNVHMNRSITAGSLAAMFAIGLGLTLYSGISIANMFKVQESKTQFHALAFSKSDTLVLEGRLIPEVENGSWGGEDGELTINQSGFVIDRSNSKVYAEIEELRIRKASPKDSVGLKMIFKARGASRPLAKEFIGLVNYVPNFEGNKLVLPNYFSLDMQNRYAMQRVTLVLIVPENTVLKTDAAIREVLDDRNFDEMEGSLFQVGKDEIHCLDCEGDQNESDVESVNIDADLESSDGDFHLEIKDGKGEDKQKGLKITISDNGKGKKEEVKIETRDENGNTKLIRKKQVGPVTITTEEKNK